MKSTLFNAILFTALLFTTLASHADAFRWVDGNGKVHIGIKPTAKPADDVDDKKTDNMPPAAAQSPTSNTPAKAVIPVNKPVETPKVAAPVAKPTPAPAPVVAAPVVKPAPVATPVKAPAPVQPAKAVQKAKVKKPAVAKKKAIVKKPVVKKAPAKKPVVKKAIAKKKPKKVIKPKKPAPVKKKAVAANSNKQRNEEMCGVFTGYVADYEEKVSECSANLCDIYKRSLARYKKKQKSYCGK